jgi:hypothetical protein
MKRIYLKALSLIGILLSTMIHAVDIKTVFLSVKHPLFIESLRPFIHSNFYELAGKNAPILKADIDDLFQSYVIQGTLDIKNHYIQFEKNGAMGIYAREYVLYFAADNLPIFIGSEQNSSLHEQFTSVFALCQEKSLSWVNCTSEIFPNQKVSDFLKHGQELNAKTAALFGIYFKLPRKGTDIELQIVHDSLTFDNLPDWKDLKAAEKAFAIEMTKFEKRKLRLTWDKPARKFRP